MYIYIGTTTTKGIETPGTQLRPLQVFNFYNDSLNLHVIDKIIDSSSLKTPKKIYSLIKDFYIVKGDYDFIYKSLNDFMKIQEISNSSPFIVIAYISILESLLTTYKPRGSYEDALNMQLQNKVSLINNKRENPLIITHYFKGPDTLDVKIIIGKIYQYRNDIAHGNESDFEKDLQILKGTSNHNILFFLRNVVKMVLIAALERPQFIKDLKQC